ncbi:MAG: hypothetical protein JXA71_15335 [Chitinispirillaceae bacterium]|nr:hypothetical protein [Chitinispirillaceae bacterium]
MHKVKRSLTAGLFFCLLIGAAGCDFPYSPLQQPDPQGTDTTPDTGVIGSGVLYQVNVNQQTCNPSVSQSPHYPGCMLWLGFNTLTVRIPPTVTGYDTTAIAQHDRLTISDTGNNVRWFIMRSEVDTRGELQDPEWSTHPDYIVCLVGLKTEPFSGCAIRLSDKAVLKINNAKLTEFSTPHIWLPDSAASGGAAAAPEWDSLGFATKATVQEFFGTTNVKCIYMIPERVGTLYFIDYSGSGDPVPVPLRKPEGKEQWYCESPLISPDGNWVVYHCYQRGTETNGDAYVSFIQRLTPDAEPVLIAEKASDPHWWVDPNSKVYYIVYSVTQGKYFSGYRYNEPVIEETGVAGTTIKQRLRGSWVDGPAHMGGLEIDPDVKPYTLVRLPFKGGLSPDGYFLATAYHYAYLMRLK